MDEEVLICQSCGMPMAAAEDFGTDADGGQTAHPSGQASGEKPLQYFSSAIFSPFCPFPISGSDGASTTGVLFKGNKNMAAAARIKSAAARIKIWLVFCIYYWQFKTFARKRFTLFASASIPAKSFRRPRGLPPHPYPNFPPQFSLASQ